VSGFGTIWNATLVGSSGPSGVGNLEAAGSADDLDDELAVLFVRVRFFGPNDAAAGFL
jgi:hypothetical protein